jgi:hypothetical protein
MNFGGQLGSAPVDAAHAADVKSIQTREEEEKFAKQHSMPTWLLGWMLIAGFILQIAGGFTSSKVDLGGIIFLIAGLKVKDGSQAALRFVIFLTSLSAIAFASLIWDAAHLRPLRVGDVGYFADDLKFWILGISPPVYLLAESILGVTALKTRQLPFWTKTVRVWAVIFGIFYGILSAQGIRKWQRNRLVERTMAPELAAARAYIATATPGVLSSSSFAASQAAFSAYPQIEGISWRGGSGGIGFGIYTRKPELTPLGGSSCEYTMWLRDAGGNWGELEMTLTLPDRSR